jgi:HEAT repeat protein
MIGVLLDMRHDPYWGVRLQVISTLEACATKTGAYEVVFPAFLEALEDENEQVVIEAIRDLAKTGDPRAVPHIVRAILSSSGDDFLSITKPDLKSFGGLPAPVLGVLREAVTSSNPAVRVKAIDLLSEMGGDEGDAPLLIAASRDQNIRVRREAVEALGRIKAKSAVPALIERLQDNDRIVVRCAVSALADIRAKDSVAALIECLKDVEIADLAAYALREIGTREARAAAQAADRRKER